MDEKQINDESQKLAGYLDSGNAKAFIDEVNQLRDERVHGKLSRDDWNSIVRKTDQLDRKGYNDDVIIVGNEKNGGYIDFGGPTFKY